MPASEPTDQYDTASADTGATAPDNKRREKEKEREEEKEEEEDEKEDLPYKPLFKYRPKSEP